MENMRSVDRHRVVKHLPRLSLQIEQVVSLIVENAAQVFFFKPTLYIWTLP